MIASLRETKAAKIANFWPIQGLSICIGGEYPAAPGMTGHLELMSFQRTSPRAPRSGGYSEEADDLLTAMHEGIGHGSGKLSDRVKGGAEPYLKEYFSTLEDARADLMAMWNVWDRKLKELGLVTEPEEVARAMYDAPARAALTQLRRIPRGEH